MKVIGIAGSLRAGSNTLDYVKTGLKVLEKKGIKTVSKKDIAPSRETTLMTFWTKCVQPRGLFWALRFI
jgi:multimeric flavodoxin WrbA